MTLKFCNIFVVHRHGFFYNIRVSQKFYNICEVRIHGFFYNTRWVKSFAIFCESLKLNLEVQDAFVKVMKVINLSGLRDAKLLILSEFVCMVWSFASQSMSSLYLTLADHQGSNKFLEPSANCTVIICLIIFESFHCVMAQFKFASTPTTIILPTTVGTFHGINCFDHITQYFCSAHLAGALQYTDCISTDGVSVLDMTLNYLILQTWRFGECRVTLYCPHSLVHFVLE